jgi:hypothetical protein
MSDGAVRQTFYVTRPTWQTGSHDWLMTEDSQTLLNQATRLLYMPDGTVCHFADPIPQQNPGMWLVSWCRLPFGCQGESACGAEMRNVVEWDRHSEPGITVIRQHLGNSQTRTVRQHGLSKLEYLTREWHYTWTANRLTHVQPPEGPGWSFPYHPRRRIR